MGTPGTTRIVLQNVDSVPESACGSRQKRLFQWWHRDEVDIALLTEMGRYWPAVNEVDRWHERTRGIFQDGIHSALGYNTHHARRASDGTRQYGGVGA